MSRKFWIISAGVVLGLASVAYVTRELPVGVNDQGGDVEVQDYEQALLDPFRMLFHLDDTPKPDASQSPALKELMDAEFFSLLRPGFTTYSTLAAMLGPNKLQSSSNLGGLKTDSYLFRNADGSTVALVFQDGVLVSKSQNGIQ